ncbi:hypothetical protein F0562_005434 [Nyssa sinensis]|uniref:RING-type E3 ubiquitin transferase n=1 Tax=Nyssa sinensis TaxID=561372 RepID=A0A5J5ALJ4_9ASTE|nr:hypothetical protein F0562_005434 [Nyssa sinensis]
MVRFSVGREDDREGPSNTRSKKQRTTCNVEHLFKEEEESEYEFEGVSTEEEEEEEEEREEEEEEEEEEGDRNEGERMDVGSESNGKGNDRGSVRSNRDGSISLTLTDPDVLDCPICLEALSIPVFQCENGHIACSCCCTKLLNKCPSCSWPIGYNRCRAIENVLESVKVRCSNMKYGCKERLSYSKKLGHEKTCMYAPCSCPLPDCDFVGSSKQLSHHFRTKHSYSATHFRYNCLFPVSLEIEQKHLILQEQSEGIIFILNNGVERIGNVVNVCCIGPRSLKRGFSYDLVVRYEGSSITLRSFTECMPSWLEHLPQKGFLLVPSDYIGSCSQLKLELCIRRHPESPAQI